MSEAAAGGSKKRRISRACDYCHQRSKRCRLRTGALQCQNCAAFNQPCTFDRPQKRRGAPSRPKLANSTPARQNHSQHEGARLHRTRTLFEDVLESSDTWRAPSIASHATILDLVELYFEVVYPIFPLFHQSSFVRQIARAEYNLDRSLFCVTMAVCALVSARVRNRAVFNPRWDTSALQEPSPSDLNTLRARAILALAAIQDGRIRDMHEHLGYYHTVLAVEGLHEEANWPKGIGAVETEERRRLFWSIYTLDVFTSIVWGGVIRSREYQSNVAYPAEVDDDMLQDMSVDTALSSLASAQTSPSKGQSNTQSISWIAGRNFVIDLYRVIEHVTMRLYAQRSRAQRPLLIDDILQAENMLPTEALLNSVMQMYANLPQCLKETNPLVSKPRLDRFGFQAADVTATVQLLRIILLSAGGANFSEKLQIANEVVSAFAAIPTAYHHAISVPLLYHLGIIGQILLSTLEQPLAENDYRSIRDVMIALVQLLSTLEGLHTSKGASQRLRDQIARIDEYMTMEKQSTSRLQQYHTLSVDSTFEVTQEPRQETMLSSVYGSATMNKTLAPSLFQLPPKLLGNFRALIRSDFSRAR